MSMADAEIQKKLVDFTCEKHGAMQVEVYQLFGKFSAPYCQACADEREAEKKRQEEAAATRRATEAKAKRLEQRLAASGIPERFKGKGFHDYETPTPGAAAILAKLKDYAEKFPEYKATGTCAMLCGELGTGKTHLACGLVEYVIREHDMAAIFVKVAHAIRRMKSTYNKGASETERQVIDAYRAPDLLVFDEIGVQFGTEAEKFILFEIVNERYEAMKPTVFLSNLAIEGLTEYAGGRVIDRMRENRGKLFIFDWNSHRGGVSDTRA